MFVNITIDCSLWRNRKRCEIPHMQHRVKEATTRVAVLIPPKLAWSTQIAESIDMVTGWQNKNTISRSCLGCPSTYVPTGYRTIHSGEWQSLPIVDDIEFRKELLCTQANRKGGDARLHHGRIMLCYKLCVVGSRGIGTMVHSSALDNLLGNQIGLRREYS